jgi:hypothetical protein
VRASKEDFVIAFNLTMKGVLVGERRVIYFKDLHRDTIKVMIKLLLELKPLQVLTNVGHT